MVSEQSHPRPDRAAAFFDVDRTLLRGSSLLSVAKPMRRAGMLPTRALLHSLVVQARFSVFGFDEVHIQDAVLSAGDLLAGIDAQRLLRFAEDAVPLQVLPRVYGEAHARIQTHRQRGELVFLVSSSPREFVAVLGSLLGVDDVAATDAELVDGRYTGRILRLCHGAGKASAVAELAARHCVELSRAWAYGDSLASDLPMLEAVAHPVCVNPDQGLLEQATSRGWPVERWETLGPVSHLLHPRRLRQLPHRLVVRSAPAVRRAHGQVRNATRALRQL